MNRHFRQLGQMDKDTDDGPLPASTYRALGKVKHENNATKVEGSRDHDYASDRMATPATAAPAKVGYAKARTGATGYEKESSTPVVPTVGSPYGNHGPE